MWIWDQSEGKLTRNGATISRGYSGKGRGRNNPALENVAGIGPIPAGRWQIGAPYNSKRVGPFTLPLSALDGEIDDTHSPSGRGAFRIHGDSIKEPGTASRGCIILPRNIRRAIWESGDRELEVVN